MLRTSIDLIFPKEAWGYAESIHAMGRLELRKIAG